MLFLKIIVLYFCKSYFKFSALSFPETFSFEQANVENWFWGIGLPTQPSLGTGFSISLLREMSICPSSDCHHGHDRLSWVNIWPRGTNPLMCQELIGCFQYIVYSVHNGKGETTENERSGQVRYRAAIISNGAPMLFSREKQKQRSRCTEDPDHIGHWRDEGNGESRCLFPSWLPGYSLFLWGYYAFPGKCFFELT